MVGSGGNFIWKLLLDLHASLFLSAPLPEIAPIVKAWKQNFQPSITMHANFHFIT